MNKQTSSPCGSGFADGGVNGNMEVRIANRLNRLSRLGLKVKLCERGANPRQRVEFQYETPVEY